MEIRKEYIDLEDSFPFRIIDDPIPSGYDMGRIFHWHDCLEISYVIKGRGRYHIEDRIYDMEPGDIIINNAEPHYLEVYEDMTQPVIVFNPCFILTDGSCSFEHEYLAPFFEDDRYFKNKINVNHPRAYIIRTSNQMIYSEYNQKSYGYKVMIKSMLLFFHVYCTFASFPLK